MTSFTYSLTDSRPLLIHSLIYSYTGSLEHMQRLELTQKEVALPLKDFAHEVVDVVVTSGRSRTPAARKLRANRSRDPRRLYVAAVILMLCYVLAADVFLISGAGAAT